MDDDDPARGLEGRPAQNEDSRGLEGRPAQNESCWVGVMTDMPSALLCATCGERIPDARRTAIPGTQFCIHCARHLERSGR